MDQHRNAIEDTSPAQQNRNDNCQDIGNAFPEQHRIAFRQRGAGLVEEGLIRMTQVLHELG